MASIPARCKRISGTDPSSTPCATPRCRRRASKTSGRTEPGNRKPVAPRPVASNLDVLTTHQRQEALQRLAEGAVSDALVCFILIGLFALLALAARHRDEFLKSTAKTDAG